MKPLPPPVALAPGLALAASPASAGVTLCISLQLPQKNHLGRNLVLFRDAVERASKGDKPISAPDDVKGETVRVFGKTLGKSIEALGGAPTPISGSEQSPAYQHGTVDADMTGVSGVKSRKLYQVVDSITVTDHAGIEFVILVNGRFWQGLSGAQRDLIQKAARRAETTVRDEMSRIEAAAYDEAKADAMMIVELSDAEVAGGVWPFILLMVATVAAIYARPDIALYIPFKM